MSRTRAALLIFVSIGWVSSAKAAGTNVKCAMNEDRVWVYESVVDFNLAAKLKCGEPVQIIGRVKGYVKVQTQSGVEGYVADSAFPKSALPPEPEEKPNDVQSASAAAIAHHSAAPSVSAGHSAPVAAPVSVAKSSPPSGAASSAVTAPVASTTTANISAAPVAKKPAPPTMAPAASPQPVVAASAPSTPIPTSASVVKTTAPATQSAPVEITLSTAPAASAPAPAPVPTSAPANTAPAVSVVRPESAPAPAPAYVANASSVASSDRAPAASSPAIQPVSDAVTRPAVANPDEEEDTAVRALENESAGCIHYFSAYGLSPNQYKWLAQNRKKAFASVCPAPTPSMVDFVVIFTHDVGFYNVTMPTAVHVDSNGFSDWTPMSTVDNSLMTQSEANSSHHEYVWVFHTTRGAFDPAKFSSRRKPLFSKSETNMLGSHGGYKTVMDALTFIEENGTNR